MEKEEGRSFLKEEEDGKGLEALIIFWIQIMHTVCALSVRIRHILRALFLRITYMVDALSSTSAAASATLAATSLILDNHYI